MVGLVSADHSTDTLSTQLSFIDKSKGFLGVWTVIGLRALIILGSPSISITITYIHSIRTINLKLVVIASKTMSMSVSVTKKPGLQHLIETWLDSWDHMSGSESTLLSFSMVIINISIQHKSSHRDQWVVSMRPNLGHIKNIPLVTLSVLLRHYLDLITPYSSLSTVQGFYQILLGEIRVGHLHLVSFFTGKVFNSLFCLKVPFYPECFVLRVYPSISMASITIHVSIPIRSTSITE